MEAIVRLANKTAFITGGNSGIGLATARLFVAEGARVAITGRNQATLEAAAKELGPNALAIVADATDPEQVLTNYQKLITVNKVDLVFGPFSTLLTKPASLVANQHGYAMVEGSGGGPSVFNRNLHNIFDVSLSAANNLVSFTQYILSLPAKMRPTTFAYATDDDPFTQPQIDLAKLILEQSDIKTVSYQVFPETVTNC